MYHNGVLRDEQEFIKHTAYVMQDDILYAFLTVKETLMYAGNFYLSKRLTPKQIEVHVMNIINILGNYLIV